jgi:hypothetical protein
MARVLGVGASYRRRSCRFFEENVGALDGFRSDDELERLETPERPAWFVRL